MNPLKIDGGSAFPAIEYFDEKPVAASSGMTLRDYFAGQWLIGASQYWANTAPMTLAKVAYEMADAMIAERSKGGA